MNQFGTNQSDQHAVFADFGQAARNSTERFLSRSLRLIRDPEKQLAILLKEMSNGDRILPDSSLLGGRTVTPVSE